MTNKSDKSIYKTNISNILDILKKIYTNNEYLFREIITNSIEAITNKQNSYKDLEYFIRIK